MAKSLKYLVEAPFSTIKYIYKFARHVDYRRLNQYILNINQNYDLEGILYELSRCLKDILDYELFCFTIKDSDTIHIWIDPRAYRASFLEMIKKDFPGQNIDCQVHYFDKKTLENGNHAVRNIIADELLSYQITNQKYLSRLYILPKRTMLNYHGEVINILIRTLNISIENSMKIKRLETEAAIDPLTKCYNRRAFDNYIEHDIANAERYDGDLSAVIYDLDHFKVINDTYGHPAGDMVLKEIACMVSSSIRKCDYIARYGGEEFALVLPDTKFFNAIDLAEKLRNKIEHHRMFLNDKQIKVTASFGVATLKRGSDKNRFLQEADEMLYRAKSAGRNKVMPNLKNCISSIKAFDRALRLLPPVMAESHTGRISLMKKH